MLIKPSINSADLKTVGFSYNYDWELSTAQLGYVNTSCNNYFAANECLERKMSEAVVAKEVFKANAMGVLNLNRPAWIALGIGLVLSVGAFLAANKVQSHHLADEFERDAYRHVQTLKHEIEADILCVEAVGAFFDSSQSVTRDEFSQFASEMLDYRHCMRALEWIPRVEGSQREAFEAEAVANGAQGFRILDLESQGQMIPSPRRDEHFPVFYMEPYEGNELAYGFDLASVPNRLATLQMARDSGRLSIFEPIVPVQGKADEAVVLLLLPVYDQNSEHYSAETRRESLRGFVASVCELNNFLSHAFDGMRPDINVSLFDVSDQQGETLLCDYDADSLGEVPDPTTERKPNGLQFAQILDVGQRKWKIVCTPADRYISARSVWYPWGLLLGSILLSGIVANYISTVTRHSKYRKELADRLLASTHSLAVEAEQRKQLVQTLLESEERFRELFGSMSSGVVIHKSIDNGADFTVVSMNDASERAAKISEEQAVGRKITELFPAVKKIGILELFQRVWRTGQAEDLPITHYDDGRVSVWVKGRVFKLSTGELVNVYDDVSEIMEAQQGLRHSEEQFREVVEGTDDLITVIDGDGKFRYVNHTAERIFGLTPEQCVGLDAFTFIHPDDREKTELWFDEIVRNKAMSGSIENRQVGAHGEVYHLLWTTNFHYDDDGDLTTTSGIGVDITERKEAAEALRISEEQYRLIFENMMSGFALHEMIYDDDGKPVDYRYLSANPAFVELTGVDPVGKTVREAFPSVEQIWIDTSAEVVKTGVPKRFEEHGAELDKWWDVVAVKVKENQFAMMFADMTEHRIAEELLRRSEERYALAQRAANIGSWDWDILTNKVQWSDAIEPMFGLKEGQFDQTYKGFLDCIHPEDRQFITDSLDTALEHNTKYEVEYRIVWPDGTVKWVAAIADVFCDQNAQPIRMHGIIRDITEQKTSQQQLQESNRLLEELAATDVLTELPNRRRLMEVLEREVARNQRYGGGIGVALIDIDGFKAINQTYGMGLGDRALREIAGLIRKQIRKSDFVARFEGDQFVVLLPGNRLTQLDEVIEKLRLKISEHLISDERKTFRLQASAGLALAKANDGNTADSLLSLADEALLAAKRSGGNCTKTWQEAGLPDAAVDTEESEQTRNLRKQIAGLMHKSKELSVQSIWSLVQALEARDSYTRGHSENVTRYAVGIARTLNLDAEETGVIRRAAVIHDIGKIGVPDNVLRKEGPLTDEERICIESHVLTGVRILQETRFLDRESAYIRCHHERWDGQGYPEGIPGSALPLGARILSVADSLDAITSNRVYRNGRSLGEAIDILSTEAGKQFDPLVVDALKRWVEEASQRLAVEGELTPEQLLKTERAATAVDMDLLGEQVLPD